MSNTRTCITNGEKLNKSCIDEQTYSLPDMIHKGEYSFDKLLQLETKAEIELLDKKSFQNTIACSKYIVESYDENIQKLFNT
jgi:hypothetical protein